MDLEILHRALTQHVALTDIDLVYLFGSRVKGDVGPMSDYDIGVLIRQDADRRQVAARFTHALAHLIGSDAIDVVLLNTATIELAYAVIA
jgi:predicted nucleotidyltransferase